VEGVGSLNKLDPSEDNKSDVGIVEEDIQDISRRTNERLRALRGSTVLVAGGGGFLPSFFLDVLAYANDHFLDPACRIVCVDNFITGLPTRISHLQSRPDFEFITHDIARPLELDHAVDYVVHAASIASPPLYRKYPLQTVDVNVQGTRNLLELSRRNIAKSFLYLSSSEIYGDPTPDAIPTPETYRGYVSSTGPRACYDESKRLAETLCMIYFHEFGVPVKIVRPFNVYGPRLSLDDGRVIPDFIRDALRGNPITLFSDGKTTRSFCYVTDAVTAMLLLLLSDYNGQVFNVGNDEEVTIEFVARRINAVAGNTTGIRLVESDDERYLLDNPRRRCPDLTLLKQSICWKPAVELSQDLQRAIQWQLDEQTT
jgi:dTDP-glucose 4,6-dehydratase/UDP-glucuronate decarboxylase